VSTAWWARAGETPEQVLAGVAQAGVTPEQALAGEVQAGETPEQALAGEVQAGETPEQARAGAAQVTDHRVRAADWLDTRQSTSAGCLCLGTATAPARALQRS
jgi:hypothetical protein